MVHEALESDLAYLHANAVTEDGIVDVYNRQNTRNDIALYANMWRGAYQAAALANEVIGWIDTKGAFKTSRARCGRTASWEKPCSSGHGVYFTLVRMHAPAYGSDNNAPSVILNLEPFQRGLQESRPGHRAGGVRSTGGRPGPGHRTAARRVQRPA
jgi:hypothetical protein